MASVNKVIIVGNLCQDPEVRYTQGGQAVSNFTVACNDNWTDKAGQKQERTEFVRTVAWGKTAELAGEYLQKGRQVYVEGRLQTREWTDKENRKQWTTEVVVDKLVFLGSKDGATGGQSPQRDAGSSRSGGGASRDTSGMVFPNYGRSRGKLIAGASRGDLEYYADGARQSLADPSKSQWHAASRTLLTAIEAELARGPGGGDAADDFGPPPTYSDDSEIPF